MKETEKQKLDYGKGYHTARHQNHVDKDYYEARAKIALSKFFSGLDINGKVLDFGCGLGQNIFFLPNAIGYDISDFGLEFCRQKGLTVTDNIDDLANNGFDLVFSSHVLEHHPHPKTMLEEIYSKLKPGKQLALVIPFERHGRGKFELDLNQHLFNWNFQNINNLLITCGFKIEQNKYLRGAGYHRLLALSKLNFSFYRTATNIVSRLFGIKEMMIIARKPE